MDEYDLSKNSRDRGYKAGVYGKTVRKNVQGYVKHTKTGGIPKITPSVVEESTIIMGRSGRIVKQKRPPGKKGVIKTDPKPTDYIRNERKQPKIDEGYTLREWSPEKFSGVPNVTRSTWKNYAAKYDNEYHPKIRGMGYYHIKPKHKKHI